MKFMLCALLLVITPLTSFAEELNYDCFSRSGEKFGSFYNLESDVNKALELPQKNSSSVSEVILYNWTKTYLIIVNTHTFHSLDLVWMTKINRESLFFTAEFSYDFDSEKITDSGQCKLVKPYPKKTF